MSFMATIHEIADRARKSISSYCMDECKSYCCRKGYLVLTQEQMSVVTQGKNMHGRLKVLENGKTSMHLSPACPSLKDFKCTIYTDAKRPKTCSDFPIFIEGTVVRFSPRCLAVRENKFYPFVNEFMAQGCIVIEPEVGFTEVPEL